jgi:tRNA(Ile2) C34 agmatinyltransferase TiaS
MAGYSASDAIREAVGIIADIAHVREPRARWCSVCRLRTSALGHRCSICERYSRSHVRERPRMLDSRAVKALV